MASTNDCVGLVDDVEEKGEVIDELSEQFEALRVQKELLFDLEAQIVQKSVDMADMNDVELVDDDASQEIRKTVIDGSEVDKLSSASIDEPDNISVNGAVDQSQLDENALEISKETGGGWN